MEKTEAWIVGLLVVSVLLSVCSIFVLNSKPIAIFSSTSKMTGFASGYVNGTLGSMVSYELSPTLIEFGNLTLGQNNNTERGGPKPFGLNNTGTVKINLTINGTTLFTGTSSVYKFKANCTEVNCADANGTTYQDMVQAAYLALSNWDFNDSKDNAQVHVNITVPFDESAGTKTSTVTFTASQAL